MAKLPATFLVMMLACSHSMVREQKLDVRQTSDTKSVRTRQRGPSKYTAPYTDKAGNPHPATMERGAETDTSINTGKTVTDTHWYDKIVTKWKVGFPLWIWLSIIGVLVGVGVYIFHRFTLIGRISKWLNSLRQSPPAK